MSISLRERTSMVNSRNDERETETETIPEIDESATAKCGIGKCHPRCMSRCSDMRLFTCNYSLSSMTTYCFSIYMISQITTLEKQFQLSSTESSMFLSSNEIGFLISAIFVTHLARKKHIPRILAVLGLLYGVVGFINTIPHFLMVSWNYPFYDVGQGRTGGQSHDPIHDAKRCYDGNISDVTANVTSECDSSEHLAFRHIRSMAFAVICTGMFIGGSAKGPRHGLFLTYMDDNVEKDKQGYHIGIVGGFTVLGSAMAFGLGAVFNLIYVTLETTPLTPSDHRWIGAWWLGFLVFGCSTSIVSISLMFFPKSFSASKGEKSKFGHELRDLPRAMLRLSRNAIYVLLKLASATHSLFLGGAVAFYPKYFEIQFRALPWMSNTIFGASALTGGVLSTIISGVIVSRLKLGVRGCMTVIMIVKMTAMVGFIGGLLIRCDVTQYHGHSQFSTTSLSNLNCSSNCLCDDVDFLPICGDDGLTYFSPCHAGCASVTNQTNAIYEDCACIGGDHTAKPTPCEPMCMSIFIYAAFSFVFNFIDILAFVPITVSTIRVVETRDRTFSVGFGNVAITLIGWMLGPLILGHVIDTTCLLWSRKCGDRGACSIYDVDLLRTNFHTLVMGCCAITVLLYGIVCIIIVKKGKYKTEKTDVTECLSMDTVEH